MRSRWRLLWGVVAGMAIFAGSGWAGDMNADGVTNDNGGAPFVNITDSTIQNGGTYQITAGTVTNGGVSTTGGDGLNHTVNVTSGGILQVDAGGGYTNDGTTNFTGAGSGLINNGTVENAFQMSFGTGTTYSGTGTVDNIGDLTIHTGMSAGLATLLGNTSMSLATGKLFITGDAADIGGTYNYGGGGANTYVAGSTVSIQADSGGTFGGVVNVYDADLEIRTPTGGTPATHTTTFNGAVTGANITVFDGTANFGGVVNAVNTTATPGVFTVRNGANAGFTTGAAFQSGAFTNAGITSFASGTSYTSAGNVANTGTLSFASGSIYAGTGNIVNSSGGILNNASANFAIAGGTSLTNSGTVNNNLGGIIANAGTITNNAGSTILNTGTINNTGSLSNAGSFTSNGTYAGTGAFTNTGTFINNGIFDNGLGGVQGTITNSGTMHFNQSTTYTDQNTGAVYLVNTGAVYARAEMGDLNMQALMGDLDMAGAGSSFYLTSGGSATLSGNYAFGSVAGGNAYVVPGAGNTIAFAANSSFDTGAAALNVGPGRVVILDSTAAAPVFSTTGNFTLMSGGQLDFSQGASRHAYLSATRAIFANGSRVDVGQNNTLHINGDVRFDAGSTMAFTGSSTGLSQITATGNVDIAGRTEVIFSGSRDQIESKAFLESQSSFITGVTNLYNPMYNLTLKSTALGLGVYVTGPRSVIDIMADAFGGYDYLSINKYNGGNYTDEVFASSWGAANADLSRYVQMAGQSSLGFDRSFAAFGQLYGEYAAYAGTPLMTATSNFRRMIDHQMNQYQSNLLTGGDSYSEVVYESGNSCCDLSAVKACYGGSGLGRLWAGGFGDWAEQHDKDYVMGYDYSAGGVIGGYDYSNDRLDVGIAAAYTDGTLKVNSLATKFRSDMLNVGAYGCFTHESGVYAKAALGYGYGWNKYDVIMTLGGDKNGKYDNQTYSAGMELGYIAKLPAQFNIIPAVGVDYTYLNQEGWAESIISNGAPILANEFGRSHYNSVEIPLSMRINKVIDFGSFVLIPEVRVAWVYQANDTRYHITSGYLGSGWGSTMYGAECGPNRWVIGGGIKARFSNRIDVGLDYFFDTRSRYRAHNFTGTLGVAF